MSGLQQLSLRVESAGLELQTLHATKTLLQFLLVELHHELFRGLGLGVLQG